MAAVHAAHTVAEAAVRTAAVAVRVVRTVEEALIAVAEAHETHTVAVAVRAVAVAADNEYKKNGEIINTEDYET